MNWTEFQWHAIVFAARQAHAYRAMRLPARARAHEAAVRSFARIAMKGAV